MAPGSKINLDRLRTSYDISLSPLREALSRLVADGLVELEDLRGYRVAPVSTSNLAEVTRLRVEFESLALQHSIEQGDLEWESDVMRSLYRLNRIERNPAGPESLEAWEEAHNDYHRQLIQGCGMPLLLRFCSVLHNLNDRYRRLFLATNPGDRDVRSEHIAIAEAAVARRSSRLAQLCAITSTGLAATSRGRWLRPSTRLRRPTESDAISRVHVGNKFQIREMPS